MPLLLALLPVLQTAFTWLLRVLVIKLVFKIISAFGVGFVTYKFLDGFWEFMKDRFYQGYNSLPSALIALMDIGGFSTALNIIFSGVSFVIAWYSTEKVLKVFGS